MSTGKQTKNGFLSVNIRNKHTTDIDMLTCIPPPQNNADNIKIKVAKPSIRTFGRCVSLQENKKAC